MFDKSICLAEYHSVFLFGEVDVGRANACLHKKSKIKKRKKDEEEQRQLIVILHIFGNSVINFGFKILFTSNMTTFN